MASEEFKWTPLKENTDSNHAQVFVTTKAIIERLDSTLPVSSMGAWFELSNYTDKAEFMAAAKLYAINELEDTTPNLVFTHVKNNFHFQAQALFEKNNEPYDELWTLLSLSEEDFTILNGYHGTESILSSGVKKAVETAKAHYMGYFPTDKDFAIYKLREAGMTDAVLELIEDYCNFESLAMDNYGSQSRYYNHVYKLYL